MNDYTGEISAYGDTVNIIKEPVIAVGSYLRGQALTATVLTDQELVLIVDQANYFKFIVDDLEKNMSHVNWASTATSSAAYSLKDAYDVEVLTYMSTQAIASGIVYGADDATGGTLADIDAGGTECVLLGYDQPTTHVDPLDLIARIARLLDDNSVPEEGRWFVAEPEFYEILAASSSKLLSVDYNAGQGSIRNGLVTSGLLRGFNMYRSNNMPTGSLANMVMAGHISAVSTAQTILNTENSRVEDGFGDLVKGLHVYGRKLLRDDAIALAYWSTTTDA